MHVIFISYEDITLASANVLTGGVQLLIEPVGDAAPPAQPQAQVPAHEVMVHGRKWNRAESIIIDMNMEKLHMAWHLQSALPMRCVSEIHLLLVVRWSMASTLP